MRRPGKPSTRPPGPVPRFISITMVVTGPGGKHAIYAAVDEQGLAWVYDEDVTAHKWQRLPDHPGRKKRIIDPRPKPV